MFPELLKRLAGICLMTEPQMLLGKIAALRERLEKAAQSPLSDLDQPQNFPILMEREEKLHARLESDDEYDSILIQETKSPPVLKLPSQLTARAKHLLFRGKDLIAQLKHLANTFFLSELDDDVSAQDSTSVIRLYKETAAMADTALRMIPNFPDSPSSQLQLCTGVEAIFQVITQRLRILKQTCSEKDLQVQTINRLADILVQIQGQKELPISSLHAISEQLIQEVRDGVPLKILREDPSFASRFVACKGLNLARVAARIIHQCPEFQDDTTDVISAALVCDVGLLGVGEEQLYLLCQSGGKTTRELESHSILGSQMLRESAPEAPLFAEIALYHHEQLDGTGFPNGNHSHDLSSTVKFLAVCERYVARCMANGFDRAINTRLALTNTLLDAQDGKLDSTYATFLMALSFYPAGSAIELSDGSVGLVLANATTQSHETTVSSPVVAVLREPDGSYLAKPRILDLAGRANPAVLRCLSPQEKEDWIDSEYPEWN